MILKRKERYNRHQIYDPYSLTELSRRYIINDEQGVTGILDSFTNLCVGGGYAMPHHHHHRMILQDSSTKRGEGKYVIYPIAVYPTDRPIRTIKPRRKRIRQHLFRPVPENNDSIPVPQRW